LKKDWNKWIQAISILMLANDIPSVIAINNCMNLHHQNLINQRRRLMMHTIKIFVRGGVVYEVDNLPDGFDYEIIDHDMEN
jgi:hypothetical protein